MRKQLGFTLADILIVFYIVLLLAGVFGWVWNIVKMVAVCCDPMTGMLVLRIVGIFLPPLGAVVGYL